MSFKEDVINGIIRVEGGYVNDSSDSGGETNYGITKQAAKNYGYKGDMKALPRELAFNIYEDMYWNAVKADQLPPLVQEEVVDTAVNMGVRKSGKILQRALNSLNNRGKLYKDLVCDGIIGQGTLKALNSYLETREEKVLVKALNCLQGAFYIELSEKREKDEKFVYGWLKNRVHL